VISTGVPTPESLVGQAGDYAASNFQPLPLRDLLTSVDTLKGTRNSRVYTVNTVYEGVDKRRHSQGNTGMNGAEVARQAHSKRPALPIVFVTGYVDTMVLGEIGDEQIVKKPFVGDGKS